MCSACIITEMNAAVFQKSGQHLKLLAYKATQAPIEADLLTVLVNTTASGDLPLYLQDILLADVMFGLVKPDSSLRPVSIVNVIVKAAATLLLANVNTAKLVGRTQYGFGLSRRPQECAKKVQRYLSEGFVVVKTDVENAFESVKRGLLAACATGGSRRTTFFWGAAYDDTGKPTSHPRTAPTCTCGRIEGFCIHSQSSRARQR